MKRCYLFFLVISLIFISANVKAKGADSLYVATHYNEAEYFIEMRDGVKLFTVVYTPKDESKTYPILMNRTCYNVDGTRDNKLRAPSDYLIEGGYILVYQDVRGRYMSGGTFDNMRPNIPGNDVKNKKDIDESSDTYDTIDWLIKNIKGNNGKVGIYGISYPGHYSAAALLDAHPALKAASPQAPISDFFFDDFHHQGAFLQSYMAAFAVFGYQKDSLTNKPWYSDKMMRLFKDQSANGYEFNLDLGPLKNITKKYHYDNFFWNQIVDHPNYDEFWQKRSILPHLKDIKPAVMLVGGWYDAEDLFGPINIYKTIQQNDPDAKNTIVMGPWTHGGWAREQGKHTVNDIYYGDSISTFFQLSMEKSFFDYYLKDEGEMTLPEAYMFDTGIKEWKKYDEWPPKDVKPITFSFGEKGKLLMDEKTDESAEYSYISDPDKPVPYRSVTEGLTFTPRYFMTDDQRHASYRPDVLTFKTDVLDKDVTIAGEILAQLVVSMTGTDADFVVKLIDVYPEDQPNYEHNPKNIVMAGYQQLVRHEVFRGRFRDSYSEPKPFEPGVPTNVTVPLQDVLHTFKAGHRIMIQVHSTWFPYIDRNPQKYVDNIYKANEEDFIKSEITIHGMSTVKAGGDLPTIELLEKVD
ncbi:CocE/NonD family hydrolase [Draconibacterium sp. IB214405]|uniref:CocE/NonD family hydrolase n=1 Tax=Draconibacterium sp. IB214405 TaxID=3097352 RepID=UPI002A141FD8|nr:CocE/NonD family hydrolase [Draconibacterium sp. IB214405]MDX8340158.1 CocE/NonD family hydrolase [Draconibacterium sp. IB214405]